MTWKLAPVLFLAVVLAAFAGASVRAQETDEDLAKQTQNPVANLISVPLQDNYECCIGPDGGARNVLNIQPVIPVPVSDKLTMIVPDSTTLKVGVEADYDWVKRQWTAPVNAGVSRVLTVQGQRIQLALAGKVYAASPNGTAGGLRVTASWVFAK